MASLDLGPTLSIHAHIAFLDEAGERSASHTGKDGRGVRGDLGEANGARIPKGCASHPISTEVKDLFI
jgi:hypothetical protein